MAGFHWKDKNLGVSPKFRVSISSMSLIHGTFQSLLFHNITGFKRKINTSSNAWQDYSYTLISIKKKHEGYFIYAFCMQIFLNQQKVNYKESSYYKCIFGTNISDKRTKLFKTIRPLQVYLLSLGLCQQPCTLIHVLNATYKLYLYLFSIRRGLLKLKECFH